MVDKDAFLEWAEFLGERYGTPWPDPPPGSDVLLEIDLQGAEQVRERHPDAILVMLLPPSPEAQAERLRVRGEDPQTITARLELGREEQARGYQIADAVVVNDDVERAVAQVAGILDSYRTPMAHQPGGDPPRRIPMARRRPTLMDPPVEDLLDKVDSKFTLVALSSKRARQINSYYNQLGESLGVIVPPQVTSVSGKPLTIAFEEIASSKTTYHRTDADGNDEIEADVIVVDEADPSGLEPGELTLGEVTAIAEDAAVDAAIAESGDSASGEAAAQASASDSPVAEIAVDTASDSPAAEAESDSAAEPPAPAG
jgi:DNA-directed RNA polymerase subunit omega